MIAELGFQAHDFQPIAEITLKSTDQPVLRRLLDKYPDLKTVILMDFLEESENQLAKRRDDRERGGLIWIGRGEQQKNKKISLFSDFEAKEPVNRVTQKRLGGIVGALSGTRNYETEAWLKKQLEEEKYLTIPEEDLRQLGEELQLQINLEIISRFDNKQHAYFVATLLTYGITDMNDDHVYESQDDIFDFLLIDQLRKRLKEAAKKGYYKTYRRFERNDDHVKGTIDIARHIRLNLGQQNGKLAYSYRENSVDNSLNALILAAYRAIKVKYPDLVEQKIDLDPELNGFLSELRHKMTISASPAKLIAEQNTPISHPYFQEYEEVRRVCLRILREESISIFNSENGDVSGFLYYLPDLWEDFLERIFREMDEVKQREIYFSAQKEQKYLGSDEQAQRGITSRPDYVFSLQKDFNQDRFLILDAKMKPWWVKAILPKKKEIEGSLHSLGGGDIDKCIRDMVVANASGTGVVFPVTAADEAEAKREPGGIVYERAISDFNQEQIFYILPFTVPPVGEESYSIWKDALEVSISAFKKIAREIILNSKKRYCDKLRARMKMEEDAEKYQKLMQELKTLLEGSSQDQLKAELRRLVQSYEPQPQ